MNNKPNLNTFDEPGNKTTEEAITDVHATSAGGIRKV
jgi:hypothetical protein